MDRDAARTTRSPHAASRPTAPARCGRGSRAARGSYAEMTDLPAALRDAARGARAALDARRSSARRARATAPSRRCCARPAGTPVEAVLMRYRDGRRSLCLSSQSGCPLTCEFCATGQMRFAGNLSADEILDQALHFRRLEPPRPRRLHGDGRADDEPRRGARGVRAPARPRRSPTAAPRSRRSAGSRASSGSRRPGCRSASRSRCTRPRTRCAAS